MRERHDPGKCKSCKAPMSPQNTTCWRCNTRSAPEVVPAPVDADTLLRFGATVRAGPAVGRRRNR